MAGRQLGAQATKLEMEWEEEMEEEEEDEGEGKKEKGGDKAPFIIFNGPSAHVRRKEGWKA